MKDSNHVLLNSRVLNIIIHNTIIHNIVIQHNIVLHSTFIYNTAPSYTTQHIHYVITHITIIHNISSPYTTLLFTTPSRTTPSFTESSLCYIGCKIGKCSWMGKHRHSSNQSTWYKQNQTTTYMITNSAWFHFSFSMNEWSQGVQKILPNFLRERKRFPFQ